MSGGIERDAKALAVARSIERMQTELRGLGMVVSSIELADRTSVAILRSTIEGSSLLRRIAGPIEGHHGPAQPWNDRERWVATIVGVDVMVRPDR